MLKKAFNENKFRKREIFLSLIKDEILSVDEFGKVINNITGNELGKKPGNFGYKSIAYKQNGKTLHQQVHRLVQILYNDGFTEEQPICNHKDGNRFNNHFSNLEKCSYSENMIHSVKILKSTWTEEDRKNKSIKMLKNKFGGRKLNATEVKEIRKKYNTGLYTHRTLGKEYSLHHTTIGDLLRNQIYKND